MANIKVSELPTATTFDDSDYSMIVQSGESKKITKTNMLKNVYSTSETVVGTWVNNKPIYRKVFVQDDASNISSAVSNNDIITHMECYVRRTGTNAWRPVPWLFVSGTSYGSYTWAGGYYFNYGSISFQLGSDLGNIDKLIFIIEYTKSTD